MCFMMENKPFGLIVELLIQNWNNYDNGVTKYYDQNAVGKFLHHFCPNFPNSISYAYDTHITLFENGMTLVFMVEDDRSLS